MLVYNSNSHSYETHNCYDPAVVVGQHWEIDHYQEEETPEGEEFWDEDTISTYLSLIWDYADGSFVPYT